MCAKRQTFVFKLYNENREILIVNAVFDTQNLRSDRDIFSVTL